MSLIHSVQKKGVIVLLSLALPVAPSAFAEVVFDGSIGAPLAGEMRAGSFTIGEADGQLSGANLFHSFATFNVNLGETANFTHDTASVQNIIGRVTGGSQSLLDGTIVADANLWLANPNGLLVGSGAVFDINGSLNLGSAENLLFEDGSLWPLDPPPGVAPIDFFSNGFEQPVVIDSANIVTGGDVRIVGGQLVSITNSVIDTSSNDASFAGNIDIRGETELTISASELHSDARDSGNAGLILLSGGDVEIADNLITTDAITGFSGDAIPDDFTPSGASAGYIQIDGENITLSGSALYAETASAALVNDFPGEIRLIATDTIDVLAGSIIATGTYGAGPAGTVELTAPEIQVEGSFTSPTSIQSNTYGDGDAGNIALLGNIIMIGDVSDAVGTEEGLPISIESNTFNEVAGFAGSISLEGDSISLGNARLESETSGAGLAGVISVTGNTLLHLSGSSLSSSSTGAGDAGLVLLFGGAIDIADSLITSDAFTNFGSTTATGKPGYIQIDGDSVTLASTGIFADSQSGEVGTAELGDLVPGVIRITANSAIDIAAGSNIGTNTFGSGAAGQIFAIVGSISAVDGELDLPAAGRLSVTDSSIASSSFSSGDAGFVGLAASQIDISSSDIASNAFPQITAATPAGVTTGGLTGAAGFIQIFGDDIALAGATLLAQSQSAETGGPIGPAGQIPGEIQVIATQAIEVSAGSEISTSTFGAASAGIINVQVGVPNEVGEVELSEAGVLRVSGSAEISSSSFSSGDAGIVALAAAAVDINDSDITSDAFPAITDELGSLGFTTEGLTGAAGYIQIDGDNIALAGARISAESQSAESGGPIGSAGQLPGEIQITASQAIDVSAGSAISTSTFGNGNAGNIALSGDVVGLSGVKIESATSSGGDAGLVSLTGNTSLSVEEAEVTSSSTSTGNAGYLTLAAGEVAITDSEITSDAFPDTLDPDTTGSSAGVISIDGQNIRLSGSGVYAESASDVTNVLYPGEIALSAGNTIDLADSQLGTSTFGAAPAGSIQVDADVLRLSVAEIKSESLGEIKGAAGNSGQVILTIGTQLSMQNGIVSTNSLVSTGGDITVNTTNSEILLRESAIQASAGADGDGGNVFLATDLLVLEKSAVLAEAISGRGGFINIDGKVIGGSTGSPLRSEINVIQDYHSRISADSDTGTAGTVNIASPNNDISAIVATQNVDTLEAPELASDQCDRSANKSRLTTKPPGSVHGVPDAHMSIASATMGSGGGAEAAPIFMVACNDALVQAGEDHE